MTEPVLTEEARSSLVDELFALHHAVDPDAHVCILSGPGRDAELIAAVDEMRGKAAEIGDDRMKTQLDDVLDPMDDDRLNQEAGALQTDLREAGTDRAPTLDEIGAVGPADDEPGDDR